MTVCIYYFLMVYDIAVLHHRSRVSSSFRTQFSTLLFATFYLICRHHPSCFYILRRLLGLSRRISFGNPLTSSWRFSSLRDLGLFTLYVHHFLHLSRCLDVWTFLPSCLSSSSRRHLYVIFRPSITSHCQCLQPQQRLKQPSSPWLSFEPTARDAVCASPHYTLPVACRSSLRRRCPAYQSSSNSLQLIAAAAYNNIHNSNCRLLNLKLSF